MNLKASPVLVAFLVFTTTMLGQTIERVEPPNWWTGMKNERLQIMIYGENIGDLEASTQYEGVAVKGSATPGNPNYLFIDLEIQESARPGQVQLSLYRKDVKITSFDYPLWPREKGSEEREGFTTRDAIYLITPDRFANGDPDNDNIPGMHENVMRTNKNGRHGGDIEGMKQHLHYIRDMGFTAVWPMPVLENNMPVYSYHGYAITDFYRVDPRMGTNDSYRAFSAEARRQGLKLIMDMIVNHCGAGHWWMNDLPSSDWINYNGEPYQETNHVKTVQMDPHVAKEDRRIAEEGWFVTSMPDLNTDNPWLATYLIQNSIWWVEYANLAGIRMDTYLYPEEAFMSAWSKAVMEEYPHFNIVGEVWHDDPVIVSYWQKGSRHNPNGHSALPTLFDFPVHYAMVRALNSPEGWEAGWRYLYDMMAHDFLYPDPQNLVVFADNHDMPRLFSKLQEDKVRLKNALAFILTTRGIPQLYYGTEILMTSPSTRDDGAIRADMPGGWPGDTINAFTGDGLKGDQKDTQKFLKQLLNWRKSSPVIHQGKLTHYLPQNGVYVYFRHDNDQAIMVILNKNEGPVQLPLDRFKPVLNGHDSARNVLTGKAVTLKDNLLLENAGPLILELK